MSHASKGSKEKVFTPTDEEEDEPVLQVVDRDPTGRYERYAIALGKGAFKTVYKAFDQDEGVEVAWNQLRVDHLSPKDATKFQAEVELLASLRHPNIIQLYYSWCAKNANGQEVVYFITELMTSGTLKRYLKRTNGAIRPKFLKTVCVQILKALNYLHTSNPPVLHRDLKCENIFVNGNTAEVKLGDLGLATVKQMRHVTSVIGTPEFMAPELYDERYDEKVDIYAFGMCVLEMVTKEYPYSECTNQAQIYKRVTSGIKPDALNKIDDPVLRSIVEMCLDFNPENRPSADQLLLHPFFKIGDASTPKLGPQDSTLSSSPDTQFKPSTGAQFALPPTISKSNSNDAHGLQAPRVPFSHGLQTHTVPLASSASSDPRLPAVLAGVIHAQGIHMDGTMSAGQTIHGYFAGAPIPSIPTQLGTNTSPVAAATTNSIMFGTPPDQIVRPLRQGSEVAMQFVHGNVELVENIQGLKLVLRMFCRVPGTSKNQKLRFTFVLDSDTPETIVSEMLEQELLEEGDRELAIKNIQRIVRKACGLVYDDDIPPPTTSAAMPDASTLQMSPKKQPRGLSQVSMQGRMTTPTPGTPTNGAFVVNRVKSPPIAPMALPSSNFRTSLDMERPMSSNGNMGHDRTLSDSFTAYGMPARPAAIREIYSQEVHSPGGHRRSSSQNSIKDLSNISPTNFSRGTSSGAVHASQQRIKEEDELDERMTRSLYGVIGEPTSYDRDLYATPSTTHGMVRMVRNDSLMSNEGLMDRSRSSTLESKEFSEWMALQPVTMEAMNVQPVVIGNVPRRGSIHNRRVGDVALNGLSTTITSHPMMPRNTQSTNDSSATYALQMETALPSPSLSQHQHNTSIASLPTLHMELEDTHDSISTPGINDYDEEELTNVIEDDPELMMLWERQKREAEEMARNHAEEWGRVLVLLKEKRKTKQSEESDQ